MARVVIPKGPYFSPCAQLQRFQGLVEKHGNRAYSAGAFKSEREAYIAAMFLLGYIQITAQDWWLRQPQQDPPDIIAVSYDASASNVALLNIEIFEYESHSCDDLVDAIARKLSGKAYPPDYRLLCYVHHRMGEAFNPVEVAHRVTALNPSLSEIWVVASIMSDDPTEHVVVRLFPSPFGQRVLPLAECAGSKQPDMLEPTWGRDSGDVTFGWQVVPLP